MLDRMDRAPSTPNQQQPTSRPPPHHKSDRDPRRQGVYPLILPGAVFQILQKLLRSGAEGHKRRTRNGLRRGFGRGLPMRRLALPRLWGGHLSGSPHPPKISTERECTDEDSHE